MVLLAIRQAHISRNHIANTASSLVLGLGLNQLGTHTTKRIQCEGDKNDWQSLLEKAKKGMASEDRALDAMARKLGGRIQDTIDSGIPTQLSYGGSVGPSDSDELISTTCSLILLSTICSVMRRFHFWVLRWPRCKEGRKGCCKHPR